MLKRINDELNVITKVISELLRKTTNDAAKEKTFGSKPKNASSNPVKSKCPFNFKNPNGTKKQCNICPYFQKQNKRRSRKDWLMCVFDKRFNGFYEW